MVDLFEFKKTGHLKLDKIFFESYYPILFTCINEEKDVFLCVCCQADSNIKKWLITKVPPKTVIELLSNKITIRDSFLKDNGGKYTIIYNNNKKEYEIEEDNINDWDKNNSIDLPTSGEYIDAEQDEFLEEIKYFQSMGIKYDSFVKPANIVINTDNIQYEKDFNIVNYTDSIYHTKYTIDNIEDFKNNKYNKIFKSLIIDIVNSQNGLNTRLGEYINNHIDSQLTNKRFNWEHTEDLCFGNKSLGTKNSAAEAA